MVTSFRDVFAIRVGDHVELRSAVNPPKAKVSKLTSYVVEKVGRYVNDPRSPWGDRWIEKDTKVKKVFKQVFWIGGTVLCYTKYSNFMILFNRKVPKDKLVKLKPAQAENVLNRKWRAKNL